MKINKILAAGIAATLAVTSLSAVVSAEAVTKEFEMANTVGTIETKGNLGGRELALIAEANAGVLVQNPDLAAGTGTPAAGTVIIENFDNKILNSTPNEEELGEFASGLIAYITTTTREQWMQTLGDKIRSIGEEFEAKFNDTSSLFKAVDTTSGYEIYTKASDNSQPEKLITLTEQPDRWDCELRANIDGLDVGFRGVVNTYGDFKKILGIFAKTLDTAGKTVEANDLSLVAEAL